MLGRFTFLCLFSAAAVLQAQSVTSGFEDLGLAPNSFLNDSGTGGAFNSGNISLPNTYDDMFDFWGGWAISSITDNTTAGYINQYGVIDGGGAGGSATFAVGYGFDAAIMRLTGSSAGRTVLGLSISNSTYTYYSMRDGDAFAKRFGGISGNDPDFLKLTIRKYLNGQLSTDSIDFYLADYRFANNTQDYLVDEWTYIDLSGLGQADSLSFELSSSDVGAFGMNTPAYFCIDNVVTESVTAVGEAPVPASLWVYPNPTTDQIRFEVPAYGGLVSVLDVHGRTVVGAQAVGDSPFQMSVGHLPPGLYTLMLETPTGSYQSRIVKR